MGVTIRDEALEARSRYYRFISDLGTEMALQWSLRKHSHRLDRVLDTCRWCIIERRVLKHGHMASVKKPPLWWKRFIEEWQRSLHEVMER